MRQDEPHQPIASAGWTAIAFVLIASATLSPQSGASDAAASMVSTSLPENAADWRDVVLNVLLYVPLGLTLGIRGLGTARIFFVALATSLTTEVLQLLVPGRDPAVIDLVTNIAGAHLGAVLARTPAGRAATARLPAWERAIARARRPDRPLAARLFMAWSAGVAGVVMATAWLLTPAPPDPYFYAVAAPDLDLRPGGALRVGSDGYGLFRGLIDEVRIYSAARPAGDIRRDATAPAPAVPGEADLVAAYSFDLAEGHTVRDDSGRGHDAVLRGTTWVREGRRGGALSFDGRSSEVVVPPSPDFDLERAMTLEAWVFPVGVSPRRPVVISHEMNAYYLFASFDSGRYRAAGGGHFGGAPASAQLPHPIQPNRWTHLAVTYDGQQLRLYVDGGLAAVQVRWSAHRPASMRWNGAALPFGLVPDPHRFLAELLGRINLDVTVVCGTTSPPRAPLFSIVGVGSEEPLTLLAVGDDLEVQVSTRATRLGLPSPRYQIADVLRGCGPGESLSIAVSGPLQGVSVRRDGAPVEGRRPGIGAGWAFALHSEALPGPLQVALTFVWMTLLLAPLAFWAGPRLATGAGVVGIAVAIFIARSLWGVAGFDTIEIAAAAAAVLAGIVYRFAPTVSSRASAASPS